MADNTYQPKTYRKQGGDEYVIASGGKARVESGGEVLVESGGKTNVESGGEIVIKSGGKITIDAGGDIDAGQIYDGADIKDVATENVIGGIPVLHMFTIAAGANADQDITLTHKTRVIDAWMILTGAGVVSAVFTVKNGANAISDALDASGSDKGLVRMATLDDAQHEVAAAGTLRVTGSGGATQPAALVYVLGMRVA